MNAAPTPRALVDRIVARIEAAGGWLRFDDYMRMALYEPGLGYYTSGLRKFGRYARDGSDFVTAPELGNVFGRTLAVAVADVCAATVPEVLEFGAGSGALAATMLAALGDRCRRYRILELSAELRERQRATVAARLPSALDKVEWLDRLPESLQGAVIANEVLDAMPVRVIRRSEGGWDEMGVVLASGDTDDAPARFGWSSRAADAELLAAAMRIVPDAEALAGGYTTELGLEAAAFTATLAERLVDGAAFLIDYGFPAREYYHPQRAGGTLICHRAHTAHDDPFDAPGLTDITAHVDFSAIAEAAHGAGADIAGYTTQARFLMNCAALESLGPDEVLQARLLLGESEMGELFKVMALARGAGSIAAGRGFSRGDRTGRL